MKRHLSIGVSQRERASGRYNLLNVEYLAEYNNLKNKSNSMVVPYKWSQINMNKISDFLHFIK